MSRRRQTRDVTFQQKDKIMKLSASHTLHQGLTPKLVIHLVIFAVMADEVRKLAERKDKTAKEITGVIETLQAETIEAVQSMEAGIPDAQNRMQLA